MPDLKRLLDVAHYRTHGQLPHNTPMQDLLNRAADRAEQVIDAPLGTAVAEVLAMEAEHLRAAGWDSPLSGSKMLTALALVVLDLAQETADAARGQAPPPHDLTMPHDIRYPVDDARHCPPNCPHRRWMEA